MTHSNVRWRWLHFAALSLAAALFSSVLWHSDRLSIQPMMRELDNVLFDIGFRARGEVSHSQVETLPHTRDIVMVESTHQLTRPILARLIKQLRLARVVALDYMLVDDHQSFESGEEKLYQKEIARWKHETAILAREVKAHGRIILASWPEEERVENPHNRLDPQLQTVWRRPPLALWNATSHHAHVVIEHDANVARRVRLLQPIDTKTTQKPNTSLPCLGLAIAALSQRQNVTQWLQKHPIPTNANGAMPINWLGGREVFGQLSNSIGYLQVLDLWEAEDFRDKIVIVGEVSRQAKEIALTPWGEAPAMQAHANVAATLLDARGPLQTPHSGLVLGLSFVACWCLSLPLLRWPLWTSFMLAVILGLGVVGGVAWMLAAQRTMWPGSVALMSILLSMNALALYEYRRTRHTLGRFVGSEMMARALHPLNDLQPGGREEVATAMFCDLRDYSTLAEKMPASQVTLLINDYSTLLLRVIARHGGRVVDYQGDGVFILFETALAGPEHALKAVRAALEIQEEFRVFNHSWRQRADRDLEMGIGVESGTMMIGILGSSDRIHLGAVGDAVNVAARVQSLTREIGASIVITNHVCELLGQSSDQFRIEAHGQRAVKGRTQLVDLYAVLGLANS